MLYAGIVIKVPFTPISASMQSQRWDDASDFGLIENDENK